MDIQFINLLSGSHFRVGDHLESCTKEVQISDSFELDGRTVVLIDTPGFDDTNVSDTNVLNMIATYLSYRYFPFLLAINITRLTLFRRTAIHMDNTWLGLYICIGSLIIVSGAYQRVTSACFVKYVVKIPSAAWLLPPLCGTRSMKPSEAGERRNYPLKKYSSKPQSIRALVFSGTVMISSRQGRSLTPLSGDTEHQSRCKSKTNLVAVLISQKPKLVQSCVKRYSSRWNVIAKKSKALCLISKKPTGIATNKADKSWLMSARK